MFRSRVKAKTNIRARSRWLERSRKKAVFAFCMALVAWSSPCACRDDPRLICSPLLASVGSAIITLRWRHRLD